MFSLVRRNRHIQHRLMKSLLFSFSEIETLRVFAMPIFLLISRHNPEHCPIHNEKTRKVYMEYFKNIDRLMKKHGIKDLGSCAVYTEHLTVALSEAPSLKAWEEFGREPEVLALTAYERMEVKLAVSMEEAMKMIKKAK
jgi:hypothetical protein